MKKIKKLLMLLLVFAMTISIIPTTTSAAVKINKTSISLEVGKTATLKITGTKKTVKWSSSNKLIATVNTKGKVTAKKEGVATITARVSNKSYKCKVTVKGVNLKEKIEIVAEYTLPDGIGWYTRHFMIVKNNSNKTVDISTSTLAYSINGEMVAADEGEIVALGAGCTSVFYEAFDTNEDIGSYETEITVKESKYYKSVIQDLSYKQNDIDSGAIFQVKNNGDYAAEFVQGYALFFYNGELVEYDTAYFTDDDFEIKPGRTISKQFKSYREFDTIEFYLTGRR